MVIRSACHCVLFMPHLTSHYYYHYHCMYCYHHDLFSIISIIITIIISISIFFSIIETMLYISWKSLINQNLKTHFKMWHGNTVASTQASVTKSTTYLPISAGYLWTSEADVTPTCCIVTTSKLTKKAKENKMDKIHLASEVFKKQLFKLEL